MKMPANVQIIYSPDGKPAYAVVPYELYVAQLTKGLIPHEVVSRMVDGANIIRAWREHLGFTQEEVARRLGISQSAYAQQEAAGKVRKTTRAKLAVAFGIDESMLRL